MKILLSMNYTYPPSLLFDFCSLRKFYHPSIKLFLQSILIIILDSFLSKTRISPSRESILFALYYSPLTITHSTAENGHQYYGPVGILPRRLSRTQKQSDAKWQGM